MRGGARISQSHAELLSDIKRRRAKGHIILHSDEEKGVLLRRHSRSVRRVLSETEWREIPLFAGRRFQHGHGLGSILSGFFRRLVLPFFKAHGKKILANVVKTGAEVAHDVLEGKTVKEAAKRRIPTGIKRTLLGIGPQSGSGVRRRKRRKIVRDIFS